MDILNFLFGLGCGMILKHWLTCMQANTISMNACDICKWYIKKQEIRQKKRSPKK